MGEILEAGKFISDLTRKRAVNILVAGVIGILIYVINEQRDQIINLNASIHNNSTRYFDNDSVMQLKLQDCNELRIKDADEINKYWRKRVEQLEANAYKGYKKLNQK